ncbi:hypothetical protein ACA30_13655 [Virgibacillus soli]|nr:hypothetical protein ACA30_13655 [Virgibacillus soli]
MWTPLLLAGASIIGLGGGGLLTRIISHFIPRKLPHIFVICGGMLVGIILFEMLPHSIMEYDIKGIIIGLLTGYVIMQLIDYILHSSEDTYVSHKALGFLITGLFFHHIIMGFSYGAATLSNSKPFLTAIMLHQIPEGIAIMTALLLARLSVWFYLNMIIILSVTLGVSALLGETVKGTSFRIDTLLTGIAIGTLVFVTFHEIIGKSKNNFKWRTLGIMILIGMGLIKIYLLMLGL